MYMKSITSQKCMFVTHRHRLPQKIILYSIVTFNALATWIDDIMHICSYK